MPEYNFTDVIKVMSLKEGIEDCKLESKYSSDKGDGYLGTVQTVKLVGRNKTADVVFKFSPRDPRSHMLLPIHDAYKAEIYFYKHILPAFEKFQNDYKIKEPFNNTPKYYTSVETLYDELLVLENLRNDNYDMWDRMKMMNRPHLELTLRTFAKFHGTSLAMKHFQPQKFDELSTNINEFGVWWGCLKRGDFYNQIDGMIRELLDIFDPDSEAVYRNKLANIGKTLKSRIEAAVRDPDSYDVIQLGDCWCNNVMFQYNEQDKREVPDNIKIFDFQMARKGPLCADLVYFFYTISPEDCIDDLDYFMKFYHDALGDHLNAFGLDAEIVFSYETFEQQWQRCAIHGFMLTINVCKMMLTDAENAPDLINDLTTFMSSIHIDHGKEMAYRQRIKHIFKHIVDRKYS